MQLLSAQHRLQSAPPVCWLQIKVYATSLQNQNRCCTIDSPALGKGFHIRPLPEPKLKCTAKSMSNSHPATLRDNFPSCFTTRPDLC